MEQRIIRNVKAERERHLKYYVGRYKPEELGAMALMRRQIFCFYGNAGCGKTMLHITEYNKEKIRFSVVISASRKLAIMLGQKSSNLMSYEIKDLEESEIESIAQKHATR